MPFFTVVIPTYNRSAFLKEAIQSVLDQTFQDFEVIVVDDHSTDNTQEVVESFHDDRITYILNDRARGGAGTRNAGIFRARGQWVAFLDDDDVWLPQKLELQYKKIKDVDSTVGLIYTGYAVYDFEMKCPMYSFLPKKEGWIQKDLLYKNYIGTLSTVAIRSDLLRRIGGLDERFAGMQDMELYVRIADVSRIVSVKDKLSHIRRSNKDRISLNLQKKLECSLLFWEKYKELINKDIRLRHRAASRVFQFAARRGNVKATLQALPWTLAGLFIDISNVFSICRSILSSFYRRLKTNFPPVHRDG
jgi:glycosyltransferase involved in cell wall biosynthesis